jgi:hypothetical protein
MTEVKPVELKTRRITIRISGTDLTFLQQEASRLNTTVGGVVRDLIRKQASNGQPHNE